MQFGKLYLLPCSLGDNVIDKSITPALKQSICSLNEFIVENEKSARKFLKEVGITISQNELIIHDYGKHTREKGDVKRFFDSLLKGKNVGLLSEAGCPAIADPGSDLVAMAHSLGIKVIPFVGPNSLILALMASGFNGQGFTFCGYLPIDKTSRSKKLKEMEALSQRLDQTQIFIETPFRNNQLIEEMLKTLSPNTKLCIASELTLETEFVVTKSVAEWKKQVLDFHKKPVVYLIHKQ